MYLSYQRKKVKKISKPSKIKSSEVDKTVRRMLYADSRQEAKMLVKKFGVLPDLIKPGHIEWQNIIDKEARIRFDRVAVIDQKHVLRGVNRFIEGAVSFKYDETFSTNEMNELESILNSFEDVGWIKDHEIEGDVIKVTLVSSSYDNLKGDYLTLLNNLKLLEEFNVEAYEKHENEK